MTTKHDKQLNRLIGKGAAMLQPDGTAKLGKAMLSKALIEQWCRDDLAQRDGRLLTPTARARAYITRRQGHGDHVDAYQAQHQRRCRAAPGQRDGARRNLSESPLSWLAHHRDASGSPYITVRQFDAGEKLRHDFETAGLSPQVTRNYAAPPIEKRHRSAVAADPGAVQLAAKQRFDRALGAVGPDLCDILWQVCCFETGLADAEKALSWPARSGKLVLRIALDRLADHYAGK